MIAPHSVLRVFLRSGQGPMRPTSLTRNRIASASVARVFLRSGGPCWRDHTGKEQRCVVPIPCSAARPAVTSTLSYQQLLACSLRELILLRVKIQRRRVNAEPQPCRPRPIREQVPQVSIAARAQNLGPVHPVRGVRLRADVFRADRQIKAWPAGAGVELGFRAEQVRAATGAAVQALVMVVPILASESRLGPLLPRDVELLGGELGLPFRFRLLDLVHTLNYYRTGIITLPVTLPVRP